MGLEAQLRKQSAACTALGSPLTAALLHAAADDYARRGAVRALLADWRTPAHKDDAMALRLAGGLHDAVLAGRAPALARFYPSAGGRFGAAEGQALWQAARGHIGASRRSLRRWMERSVPQTNEVGRAAALLAGLLQIAAATRLPLALYEIGASAGLNLLLDQFAYRLGRHRWGERAARVQLRCAWHGRAPALDAPLQVRARRGCDIAPVRWRKAHERRRLEAWVWPDMMARLTALRAALDLAAKRPPRVEKSTAAAWAAKRLAAPRQGEVRVLMHSVVWPYLPSAERRAIAAHMEALGTRASAAAPIAWLAFEPGARVAQGFVLRLRLWGAGDARPRVLARGQPHGSAVRWLL